MIGMRARSIADLLCGIPEKLSDRDALSLALDMNLDTHTRPAT